MERDAVLYALSTLAQTCAALAALIGAIGLYRLQFLRGQQQSLLRDIAANLGYSTIMKTDQLLDAARQRAADHPTIPEMLRDYGAMPGRIKWSAVGFAVFEAWSLAVIGASLVGFNYLPLLVGSPYMYWGLLVAAVGTIGMTAFAVFTWTRQE